MLDQLLQEVSSEARQRKTTSATWDKRAQYILDGCTPHQRQFIKDPSKRKALRCPRRSGKSWCVSSNATYLGESFPGMRVLIISLTLKSTRENYWSGSTAGIFTMDRTYNLGLSYNHTNLEWRHENGSRGLIRGAETRADIEYLRGAAAEADVALVDECKSFAPQLLEELLQDVLEPGLMTRGGTLVLAGTPGLIPSGIFYEATATEARADDGSFTCIPYELRSDKRYEHCPEDLWSLHSWTIADNIAVPAQWDNALANKRRYGWSDDHPTWRREYLGEWVTDSSGLVYAFAGLRHTGKVSWEPQRTKTNKSGLDPEEGPWHYLVGVDFGYEDDFAICLAAYSEQLRELRHVYDFKSPHLTVEQMAEAIHDVIAKYGAPSAIVGDAGGLGKLVIESLNATYRLPVVAAEKTEKYDHIELLNSDFHAGRIKIILGSNLDNELCGLQWDLSKDTKEKLVRKGRLREDARCPNHLCDALLYLWRYSYHYFAQPTERPAKPGTPEWFKARDEEAALLATTRRQSRRFSTETDPRAHGPRPNLRLEAMWRQAPRNATKH